MLSFRRGRISLGIAKTYTHSRDSAELRITPVKLYVTYILKRALGQGTCDFASE